MAYVALYRQWRPQHFEEVVGQEHISRTFKNAINGERIAHAYLFTGPRGTGKTSSAKILAKAVNCLNSADGEPCNECDSCKRITEGNSMDVIEIDAASNRGIDEIRDLREKVKFAPAESRYKVYIIDEVHMLTMEAFNALLKTLEEPPKHVIFILATTEPHKIPLTILSRCQRFDFRRIGQKDIVDRLAKIVEASGLNVDTRAIQMIAKKAEGGMRDALSLLDQCLSCTDDQITEETVSSILGTVDRDFINGFVKAVAKRDMAVILQHIDKLVGEGKDLKQFLHDLLEHFRNLLLTKLANDPAHVSDVPDFLYGMLKEQSELFSENKIFQIMQILSETEANIKYTSQPRIIFEVNMMKAVVTENQNRAYIEKDHVIREEPVRERVISKKVEDSDRQVIQNEDKYEDKPNEVKEERSESKNININYIKEQWEQVLEAVKKQNRSSYAYLIEGKPTQIKENKIMLLYDHKYEKIHMKNIDQQVHKMVIEKALWVVYKHKLTVQGFLAEDVEGKNDLVESAKELFGADVLEITD